MKDQASKNYGNLDGVSLCGLRTYAWSWVSGPTNSIATTTTTTKSGDTIRIAPTAVADEGTFTL